MPSTVEVAAEHAAVERGKMLASAEEKNPAVEKDNNSTIEGGGIGMNLEGKEQPRIDSGAEKSCNDEKTQEPIDSGAERSCNDKGGSAMVNKGQILSKVENIEVPADVEGNNGAEQTDLLVDPEEADASKNQQMKKKEKRRKRVELRKIKKEQQLGNDEKTQVPAIAEEPICDAENTHLLVVPEKEKKAQMKKKEKKRKRMELQNIKKEQQLGSVEKTCVSIDSEERATAWRWHASYSMRRFHCQTRKLYEGSILLQAKVKRVVLIDTDERIIDAYYLKEGESVHPGSVFEFQCNEVDIGERILQPDVCIEDEAVAATTERGIENENEKPPSKRDEKRKRLKRKPQAHEIDDS